MTLRECERVDTSVNVSLLKPAISSLITASSQSCGEITRVNIFDLYFKIYLGRT